MIGRDTCPVCGATVIRVEPSGPALERTKTGLVTHDCLDSMRRRYAGARIRKEEAATSERRTGP